MTRRVTFAEALKKLNDKQFTGQTIVHWAQGHIKEIVVPGEPERLVIDNSRPKT